MIMLETIRQWLKSWTIKFGLLLQIAAQVQVYYEDLGDPFATMLVSIIIIGLRFKTTQPVSEK